MYNFTRQPVANMLKNSVMRKGAPNLSLKNTNIPILRSIASYYYALNIKPNASENTSNNKSYACNAFLGVAGLAAATVGYCSSTKVHNEYQYQTLPQQKYPDPRPLPKHGPEFHHSDPNNPPPRPDLPTIPLEKVEEHNDEDSMWFTYRGAVYDMTFFLNGHAGGKPRLLMAAGQDLEPYWDIYRQHFRGHIVPWMEKYRIGNLSPEDAKKASNFTFGDMFESDPMRDKNLLPCTWRPFNGEPRIDLLTENYLTPNELFYVRNHLNVPDIDPEEYVLVVKGKGIKRHKFTLEDLKTKFPKHEVVTTLQCAGNRREDLHGDKKIFISPHWVVGAMSNAKWGGVKMSDVLKHCGLDVDGMALNKVHPEGVNHLIFEGYDTDETGFNYGISIPIDKAIDPYGEAIFAFEMNDEPLPRDHGFPVRAIVPGHVGNTNCKWLHKVIVSDKETDKPWCQKSYRGFAPDIEFEDILSHWPHPKARLDQSTIVQEMPVQSFVCNPPQNSIMGVRDGTEITLKGVAWAGGGRKIERVDVSIDGGKNFTASELYKPIDQKRNRHWGWTQFYQTIKLPHDVQQKLKEGKRVNLDIVSKAMNSDFNVQPETMEPYWNARGVCINHWYHVNVTLDPNLENGEVVHANVTDEFQNTPSGGSFHYPWGEHGFQMDPKHMSDPKENVAPESKHF